MTRTVLITPEYTLLSGTPEPRRTPLDTYEAGPEALARRVAPLFGSGEGVVLVDREGARRLNLADSWLTVDGDPRVYLGVVDEQDNPLVRDLWHQDTVQSFAMFHDLMGVAYHRSPGVAGLSLLQHLYPKGKTKPIVWQSDGPADAYELQYYPEDFRRADPARYVHGYDRRRSGLAAMGNLQVARYALRHTRKRTFDQRLAGWWRVEVPAWNDPTMPNPAGYCEHDAGGPNHVCIRWLTTPTIVLLNELATQGVSEGVRFMHDSWVADQSRLFEQWANVIEHAHSQAEKAMSGRDSAGLPLAHAMDAERVRDAVKAVYRETPGMFAAASSWVRRPDWFAAKVALERCNAWRAVWRSTRAALRPQYPCMVDGDKWWFPSDVEDGVAAAPAGISIGNKLGQWRYDGTVVRP
jgi:hypothetical protein